MTLWERRNNGDSRKTGIREEGEWAEHTGSSGQCDTIMGNPCHETLSKPGECPTPGVNPNTDHGLWAITMYLSRLSHCHQCGMLTVRETLSVWGRGVVRTLHSAQFCCESKLLLKN